MAQEACPAKGEQAVDNRERVERMALGARPARAVAREKQREAVEAHNRERAESIARVDALAQEVVARARVVEWAREVLGLGAQPPAREARCLQPRVVMERWEERPDPARAE
jgi:hypothetical protein